MGWDGFLWEKLNASKCVIFVSENIYFLSKETFTENRL
jgi:hypothetical protein